jgi:8-oxo-dGTP pyrophosphatase MutT (NUDIX family)
MELEAHEVEDAHGARSEYGVVKRHDFVLVIPVRGQELLLVRQYRYPIKAWTFEFPQGALEDEETPAEAARRELREETGADVEDLRLLGRVFEAAGFATHSCQVFVGEVTGMAAPARDVSEGGMIEVWLPIEEVKQMIRLGRLEDASSLAAWALAREQGWFGE